MAFSSMKLKPESGARLIALIAPMTLIHSWCTCSFLIKTSRIGRWLGRPSTMSARQTRVKFRLGELFGRRPPLKAGL
jgi:hypothetical protein